MDKSKISEEILNYFELNENKNTSCQLLWASAKAVLRGKSIALNAYIKKEN